MFGLFKSEPFGDAQIGELRRSGGHWKGSLELAPCGTFRLSLAGSRKAPDSAALALAKELPGRFKTLVPKIEGACLITTRRTKKRLTPENRRAVLVRTLRARKGCGPTSHLLMFLSSRLDLAKGRRWKLRSASNGMWNTQSLRYTGTGNS
jgi:hypothetical protein